MGPSPLDRLARGSWATPCALHTSKPLCSLSPPFVLGWQTIHSLIGRVRPPFLFRWGNRWIVVGPATAGRGCADEGGRAGGGCRGARACIADGGRGAEAGSEAEFLTPTLTLTLTLTPAI
eukprot:scaffold47602_cov76-Phaeocystis_antarctica.AAC.3